MRVIAGEATLYQKPDRFSPKLATLRYGQEVLVLPKKTRSGLGDWTEVRLDKDSTGFVSASALGTSEIIAALKKLQQSVEGKEVQAIGMTSAAAYFRLEPGRQGKPVEKLPKDTSFEMFERQATLRTDPAKTGSLSAQKDVWYKVRLADGRVGYIHSSNFKLQPPAELAEYTGFRRTLAWQKLRTVTGKDSHSAQEYIVAYVSPGDLGVDFDRVEVYIWDGKRYQTAFSKSSLRGILPLRVLHQDDGIFFEVTELDPEHEKQMIVQRYSYPYPYKKVASIPLQQDAGLH